MTERVFPIPLLSISASPESPYVPPSPFGIFLNRLVPEIDNGLPLAKISENAKLRRMAACIVSFVDLDGVRHSVEVQADGLYEAGVLGLCAFRKHDLEPGGLTELEVEVRSSIKHAITVTKLREWLQRGVRTPKEAVLKERLRALL